MATLSTLRNAVYSKLGMDSESSGNDETLVTQWLNEGVREVLLRTHCRVQCADMSLIGGTWKYNLPSTVLALKHVVDGNSNLAEIVTFPDLLELRRADNTDGSSVPLRVAMLGSNLFALWPTPADGDSLEVYYVPKPTEMSQSTHDPSDPVYGGVPTEYHKAIELWALSQGSDHEHEQRTQNGIKYEQQFELYLGRVKGAINRMPGGKGVARVGRRRQFRAANDVDVMWG